MTTFLSETCVWESQEASRQEKWGELYLQELALQKKYSSLSRPMDVEAETATPKHGTFSVVQWSKLAMFDWDLAGEGDEPSWDKIHPEELPELKRRVGRMVAKGFGVRLYRTPGGYRAFLTSTTPTLYDWLQLAHWLHVDLFYMGYRVRYAAHGWACRVSPKPNREGDYVARLIGQYGPVSEELLPFVEQHDRLIRRFNKEGV